MNTRVVTFALLLTACAADLDAPDVVADEAPVDQALTEQQCIDFAISNLRSYVLFVPPYNCTQNSSTSSSPPLPAPYDKYHYDCDNTPDVAIWAEPSSYTSATHQRYRINVWHYTAPWAVWGSWSSGTTYSCPCFSADNPSCFAL